jgi:hypothetical protein
MLFTGQIQVWDGKKFVCAVEIENETPAQIDRRLDDMADIWDGYRLDVHLEQVD